MGEGLPFMFQRFDIMPPAVTKLKRSYKEYLRQNLHYTFSGFNFPPAFLDLFLELGGVERIMFSADHPYQSMPQARAFLDQIPGERRRQGTHRARQRGETFQVVAQRNPGWPIRRLAVHRGTDLTDSRADSADDSIAAIEHAAGAATPHAGFLDDRGNAVVVN